MPSRVIRYTNLSDATATGHTVGHFRYESFKVIDVLVTAKLVKTKMKQKAHKNKPATNWPWLRKTY